MDFEAFEDARKRLSMESVGKPALIGVVVVLVMVAVLAAGRFSGAATASEFQVSKGTASEATAAEAEGGKGDAPAEPASVFVHVSGAVVRPGLCEVDEGARVADAVQAAGGFADDAVIESVNLARQVSDGEQIVVARESDAPGTASASGGVQPVAGSSAQPPGRVNINTAAADELVTLPGIGDATASKIVADRQANGPYKSIEDLKRVSGIGDRKFESLEDLICV